MAPLGASLSCSSSATIFNCHLTVSDCSKLLVFDLVYISKRVRGCSNAGKCLSSELLSTGYKLWIRGRHWKKATDFFFGINHRLPPVAATSDAQHSPLYFHLTKVFLRLYGSWWKFDWLFWQWTRICNYCCHIWHKSISVVCRNFLLKILLSTADSVSFISSTWLLQWIELFRKCSAIHRVVLQHRLLNSRLFSQPLLCKYSMILDTDPCKKSLLVIMASMHQMLREFLSFQQQKNGIISCVGSRGVSGTKKISESDVKYCITQNDGIEKRFSFEPDFCCKTTL